LDTEWVKIALSLIGTLIGGGLVMLAGWVADRRKTAAETAARQRREKALLTGMFAVRNYIAERLNEWEEKGNLSLLEPLRTGQAYVHRLIDKAPGESESLMITVIEIGLKLDALIATLDRRFDDPGLKDPVALASVITGQVSEIAASIEQLDIVSGRGLTFLSDEDLAKFPERAEAPPEEPRKGTE
jgi:hypothetical protein